MAKWEISEAAIKRVARKAREIAYRNDCGGAVSIFEEACKPEDFAKRSMVDEVVVRILQSKDDECRSVGHIATDYASVQMSRLREFQAYADHMAMATEFFADWRKHQGGQGGR